MARSFISRPAFPNNFASRGPSYRMFALAGAVLAGALTSPVMASSDIRTQLVRCGAESCLLVTGHRDGPAAIVRINDRAVEVAGNHDWRAIVPVQTVREWSVPNARAIEVSLHDPDTRAESSDSVDLPLGLLGGLTDLAPIEISLR